MAGTPRAARVAGLLLVAGLALAVRALDAPWVFVGDGEVVLRADDSQYHARRALYTFAHWPRVLDWDPYLNYPDGADVPWPPLYDFLLGTSAWLLADDEPGAWRVLAWVNPVLAALTTPVVYAIGRTVAGPGVALGAAALFALLPASIIYSDVGNADHHAAVALFAAMLLALHAAGASAATRGGRLVAVHGGLVVARLAMLLTWNGSLLYVVLAEGAAVAVLAGTGRRDALVAQGCGALATAALAAPAITHWPPSLGGPYSTLELSWMHAALLLGAAVLSVGLAALERLRPAAPGARLVRAAVLAGGVAGLLLLLPGVRAGLDHGAAFLGKQVDWIARNTENQPIFGLRSWLPARLLYGGLAFGIPLTPVAALVRARRPSVRAPALLLAVWTAVLGWLALTQSRYGNDFLPGGAVGFALILAGLAGFAARRVGRGSRAARAAVAIGLAAALLAPVLVRHVRRMPETLGWLRGTPLDRDPALATIQGTLHRFAEQVRAATPETSGFLDPERRPEYGILAFAGIGHVLQHVARRPTTANNFGPYLAGSRLAETNRFYAIVREADAVAALERLGVRYVVTAEQGRPRRRVMLHRMHRGDGTDRHGTRRLEHFRLVSEGPAGGVSIGQAQGWALPPDDVPYKLFERVVGAVLEVRGAPHEQVTAEVEIETPTARRFRYRAAAHTDAAGLARLRVPYATGSASTPVRTLGDWRITVGGAKLEARTSETDVREGRTISVGAPT